MSDTIKRITIEGFKSIRKLEDFELRPLNVLIGANGAGKSNFIEFFRLLRELVQQRLRVTVGQAGGPEACLYFGLKATKELVGKIYFAGHYGYEFSLLPASDGGLVFKDETVVFADDTRTLLDRRARRRVSLGSGHYEAKLKDIVASPLGWSGTARQGVPASVSSRLADIQVYQYHFHDTSPQAGVRHQRPISDNEFLRPDAENLAPVLYRIQQTRLDDYARIRDVVRLAAPFFDDFKLRPDPLNEEQIRLEWLQKGSDRLFLTSQLSDGTLRFICLATALLQSSRPTTLLFDEPELGLHPYALTLLANLFQQAVKRTSQQLIVTSQSAQFVNEFEPEDVIVVERTQGESVFRRLESAKLSGWLEDYSLGELWQKNVFGGGPRNEAVPIMPDDDGDSPAIPKAEGTGTGDERP
jgi:predicted ATPase